MFLLFHLSVAHLFCDKILNLAFLYTFMTDQPALNRYKIVTNIETGERYKEKRLVGLMRGTRAKVNPSLRIALEMRTPLADSIAGNSHLQMVVLDAGKEDKIIPLITRDAFEDHDRVKAIESLFMGHSLQSEIRPWMTLRAYAELKMIALHNELESIEIAKSRLKDVDQRGFAILNSITEAGRLAARLEAIKKLAESGSLERLDRTRKVREQAEQRVMKTMLEIIAAEKPHLVIVSRYLEETKVPGYEDMRI